MKALHKPLSVLLVEDNKDHVNIFRWIIGRVSTRIHIAHAEDGESGIQTLTANARASSLPDIILLDLNLPKVSGMEMLKYIRNESHLRHIPVIMLSSSSRPEDVREAYHHGANTFMSKSIIFNDFEDTVHRIVDYWTTIALLPQ